MLSYNVTNISGVKIPTPKHTTSSKRTTDKSDRATTNLVMDSRTRMMLFVLLNTGKIGKIEGILSTGKEASVFLAHKTQKQLTSDLQAGRITSKFTCVKIYSTSIMAFKNRAQYIEGEHRFQQLTRSNKNNSRKLVQLWSEKEFRNLSRMYDTRCINSPKPYIVNKTILVLDFVGDPETGAPAPTLKAAVPLLSVERRTKIYYSILRMMRDLYQKANLIHGDLSEYNMLYYNKKVHVIDVSQSVDRTHPFASELLRQDIVNVSAFFAKYDVEVPPSAQILSFITSPAIPKISDAVKYGEGADAVVDALFPEIDTTLAPLTQEDIKKGEKYDSSVNLLGHVEKEVTMRLREMHDTMAELRDPNEITNDKSFLKTRIFISLAEMDIDKLEQMGYLNQSELQNLGVDFYTEKGLNDESVEGEAEEEEEEEFIIDVIDPVSSLTETTAETNEKLEGEPEIPVKNDDDAEEENEDYNDGEEEQETDDSEEKNKIVFDRSSYSKEEWKKIQKDLKEAKKEKAATKLFTKKEKKRAELLSKKKRMGKK